MKRWEIGEKSPRKAYSLLLQNRLEGKKHSGSGSDPDFTFIDLFAGIGGIRRGFEAAGGKCVFTSEWDDYAQRTYRANFPMTTRLRVTSQISMLPIFPRTTFS